MSKVMSPSASKKRAIWHAAALICPCKGPFSDSALPLSRCSTQRSRAKFALLREEWIRIYGYFNWLLGGVTTGLGSSTTSEYQSPWSQHPLEMVRCLSVLDRTDAVGHDGIRCFHHQAQIRQQSCSVLSDTVPRCWRQVANKQSAVSMRVCRLMARYGAFAERASHLFPRFRQDVICADSTLMPDAPLSLAQKQPSRGPRATDQTPGNTCLAYRVIDSHLTRFIRRRCWVRNPFSAPLERSCGRQS